MSDREVYLGSMEKHELRKAVSAILAYLEIKLIEEWRVGEGTTYRAVPRDE